MKSAVSFYLIELYIVVLVVVLLCGTSGSGSGNGMVMVWYGRIRSKLISALLLGVLKSIAPLVWPRLAESIATRPYHFLMQALRNSQTKKKFWIQLALATQKHKWG